MEKHGKFKYTDWRQQLGARLGEAGRPSFAEAWQMLLRYEVAAAQRSGRAGRACNVLRRCVMAARGLFRNLTQRASRPVCRGANGPFLGRMKWLRGRLPARGGRLG